MPVNPSHIAQIAVPVRDLDRAKRFYGETLGLTHLFDAPPGLSFFQCGQTRLMLSQPEGPETAGSSILYYSVADAARGRSARSPRKASPSRRRRAASPGSATRTSGSPSPATARAICSA